jgi:CubicO group peptidase (beta-lactamase class C family)
LAFAVVLLATPGLAEPFPVSAPEKVGLSSERLQRVSATLQQQVDSHRIPGAVLAVARKGRLVWYESVGFRDADTGAVMPKDAIFSIASMTKPMVSVAIMMLHEEGRLMLSDPIGKHLPKLADMSVASVRTDRAGNVVAETVPALRQPTILDLLRHTSGFGYGRDNSVWPVSSSFSALTYSAAEFVATLGKTPLLGQPGTIWEYGVSTDVLGFVVEAVSGKSLGAFLQDRLWQPLGMADTSFNIPDAKKGRYALAFRNDPYHGGAQGVLHLENKPMKFECGGGCAASTAMDYLRFAQMLSNKGSFGGRRMLSDKTVELMTSDQLSPDIRERTKSRTLAEGYGFGLGFSVRTQASLAGSAGEFGWGGSYGTTFWVDPQKDLVVVFMAAAPGHAGEVVRALVKTMVLAAVAD